MKNILKIMLLILITAVIPMRLAAAVKLLYDNLPENKKAKKIHTVILTHSHVDHYGGIEGILNSGMTSVPVEIVAPDGFFEAASSENVTVGPAMQKRAASMYGILLRSPGLSIPDGYGQVNNGLAIGSGTGTSALPPTPTLVISKDVEIEFDGMKVEFLLAPHTEAPAETAFYFPAYKSICLAELCNQTQHNILTPRGAEVRDSLALSDALAKMKIWADAKNADSAWGPHTWPRWGKTEISDYIDKQSRLYRYLHDRTIEFMNQGYDMTEGAEMFGFPDELGNEWFNRGYYGATNFNVKAVYQKYLGWFDNDPASLWKLPGKTSAALYAKYLPEAGGSLLRAAREAYADGQYRWVAEILDHVRLAPGEWGGDYAPALSLQADAFEQMAYSAESGIWRNYFLTGAWRNRDTDDMNGEEGGCSAGAGAFWVLLLLMSVSYWRKRTNRRLCRDIRMD